MTVNSWIVRRATAVGSILGISLLSLSAQAAFAQMQQHTLPLVLPDGMTNQGFVRIINRSDRAGTVTIHGIDDAGERYGPHHVRTRRRREAAFQFQGPRTGQPGQGAS